MQRSDGDCEPAGMCVARGRRGDRSQADIAGPRWFIYASPGSSLQLVHIFLAEYDHHTRVGEGGGKAVEGEDIELIEITVDEATRWVLDGRIRDARTVLAVQYFFLRLWSGQPRLS